MRNPKAIFWTVHWITFFMLSLTFPISLVFVDHWFFDGQKDLGGYGGTMMLPFMVLSSVTATMVCRRLGISKDDRNVETIWRNSEAPQADAPEAFEMRYSSNIWLGLALCFAPLSLLVVALVFFVPAVPGTEIAGYLLAALFGLIALGCWLAHFYKATFIGRADEYGVKGYNGFSFRVRSVAWREIESCEVAVVHDALGQLSHPFFVFKDKSGKVLLKMLMSGTSVEQTGPFKAAVERHLSKAQS